MDKHGAVVVLQKYVFNPVTKLVAGWLPGLHLLETTGRLSGRPRRVPVGGAVEDGTLWVVSEHGHRSDYVRNIEATPQVRVRTGGRWRSGRGSVLWDVDPEPHLKKQRINASGVRAFGTDLTVVRIDLDA